MEHDFLIDEIYGERLLISIYADQRELLSNIRAARAILHSFPDVYITINPHTISFGHKNPEYIIDNHRCPVKIFHHLLPPPNHRHLEQDVSSRGLGRPWADILTALQAEFPGQQ